MKQTNNAIKFLMAQYRAIFKNAYFKGMATALVLTAGLAAGQSQAADIQDYYYSANQAGNFSTWNSGASSDWTEAKLTGTTNLGSTIAGKKADANGVVSGGTVEIGTNHNINSITASGSAIGGVAIDTTTGGKNLTATSNKVILDKGAVISSGSAFGAYVHAVSGGNVVANENYVKLNAGSGDTVTVGAAGPSDGIFGARIKTTNGNAFASGNYVEINAHKGATLTLGHGNNGIVGALAEGTGTVNVTGNKVTISVDAADSANRLALGADATKRAHTIIGGFALNQSNKASVSGDRTADSLLAASNIVDVSGISFGSDSGAYVFGGRAMNISDADGSANLIARDNIVTLSNMTVESTATVDTNDMLLIGNAAQVQDAEPGDGGQNSATAIGDGTTVNLSISDSTLSYITSGNATTSVSDTGSMAAGGYAFTQSGGGNATASKNVADIKSVTATNVNFYGGAAVVAIADNGDQAIASDNVLRIDSTRLSADNTKITAYTNNYIVGGLALLNGSTIDKASATASNNTVSVTNSEYTEETGATPITADIYGAYVQTSASGATVEASNNKVTVGPNVNVTGSVYGAGTVYGQKFTNNSVEFDATLKADSAAAASQKIIAGVTISSGDSGASASATNPDIITVTGNTVTLGANAETRNVSFYGAKLGENNKNAAKVSIVHSGNNVTLNGTHIFDDAANASVIAADELQVGSDALIHVKAGTLNISGLITGDDKYLNGTGTIADGAQVVNQGTINVFNSLAVQGNNSLIAATEKALISINGGSGATTLKSGLDSVTEEGATLKISAAGLTNYLTAPVDSSNSTTGYDLNNDGVVDVYDHKGAVQITSGGTLQFTDASVDISKFDYVAGTAAANAEAGKILVDDDSTAGKGSYIKGDHIIVAHKFADNATTATAYKDLHGIKADGINIEANTLTLGSSTLSSTQSEELYFNKATARDEINFVAMTSGTDVDENGLNTAGRNDGYHLVSEVVGSHYMLTNTQEGKQQYFTAQSGVVNGPVTITQTSTDSGNLWIQNGNWTANGQITLASGGTLTVGDDDDIDNTKEGTPENSPDATLTLNQALVLDLSNGTTAAISNIKVSGDGLHDVLNYADELDGTVSAKTERVALLDLRNGLTMSKGNNTTYNGKAVFDVTNSGIVLLSADDVNTILAQNDVDHASGTFFTAHDSGAFIVDGDVVADFNDFRNDATDTANGFNLSGDGILAANKITVEHANETSGEHNDKAYTEKSSQGLNIAGHLYVADLEINDLQLTNGGKDGKDKPADAGNYASVVKIANGTAHISKSLTSVNQTLALQNDSRLVFDTDAVKDKGTVAVDVLRADGATSNITFENGEWTANAINLSGAGSSLTVGDGNRDREDINGNETYTTLDATSLTMAKDTKASIYADGTANFKTADLSALDGAADYNNAAIQVEGELSISDSVKFGKEGSIALEKNGVLKLGNKAVNESIIKDGTYTSGTVSLISGSTFTKIRNNLGGELYLDLGANTVFGGDQVKAFKQLLFTSDSFADGVLVHGGVLNIGKATFQGVKVSELVGEGLSGYTATWDSLREFSDIFGNDVTNDTLVQTNVSAIKPGDNIQGHWGSLSMESGVANSAQVQIAGNTSLNFAAGNNGFFISSADHKSALGADIQSRNDLTLENGGIIGQINMQAGDYDAEKNLTVLNVKGPNKTTIASIMGEPDPNGSGVTGSIAEATLVSIQGGETEITKDLQYINEVEVLNGAYLNVKGKAEISDLFTLNSDAKFDTSLELEEATIAGGTTEAKDIIFNGIGDFRTGAKEDGDHSVDVVNGGLLKAETFTFKTDPTAVGNGALLVGYDLDENDATLENGTKITGTGYLEISKYLDLNGGTLVVDPAYGEATSVAAVMNFKDGTDTTYETQLNDVGIVDGSALVGKNAALGIGATLAETKEAIAKYQTNGSLSEKDYGSILYLNGQVTLTADAEIALNSAATVNTVDGIRDSLKYNLKQETTEDLRQDQYADLGLGANTAILMTEQAFISDTKGTKNGVAITFDQTNAVVNGQGGDIVLIGSFDAKDPLNFFMDKDGEGHQGALIAGQDINVYTQNGFLHTVLKAGTEAGYGEQLKVDTERAYAVMNEASNPVVETLISYHVDRGGAVAGDTTTESTEDNNSGSSTIGGAETVPASLIQQSTVTAQNNTARDGAPIVGIGSGNTENTGETTTPPTEDTGDTGTGGGADVGTGNGGNSNGGAQQPEQPSAPTTRVTGSSDFLNEVVTTSHGAPAEAAARLAIYGGAVQAAMAATSSTTDAIAARMGVGNTANITMANNGQGAALWLAPVYKTHDSDSFDSQGLDYGVDLNLYGVALGADFEFMPGLTAGIMFNVGSGDADGQGNAAANNTSNDFDYWGAAIYGNYTYDALSVTADVSYTAVDNDLEATTGMQQYGKLESSTDTTAISLGVTAKYTFDFGGVEVAPHAGLRYTNIDLDDYSIKSNGETIADYSADKVNIFSIPVGVTFAKEFTGDAWTVKPSLDLTLTGNFGDDDISGDVSWTGVDGLVTPVSSEYMDDFTYGATLGIEAASTGGFSLGLGVNYTGSSNVDEFGVNANARFVF